MNAMKALPSAKDERSKFADAEILSDYRQRRALEELERAELKRADLAEQQSTLNSADVRIRAWERVHGLRMPADSKHPILKVIATSTQLTLVDVQNEQRLRFARSALAGT